MKNPSQDDIEFMKRAAELGWKGRKHVQSNPMVGAVFAKNGKIIGEGYHKKFGDLHAEIAAIEDAKGKGHSLKGSTLYVTLEPCCHQGKQGPCTEDLKPLGLKKIVYAQLDVDKQVEGKGIKALKKSNIQATYFSLPQTIELNEIYLKNRKTGLPFVHLKSACTLDGKITLTPNAPTPLGNSKSLKQVHVLRDRYDAILIGVNTLLIDNPKLTTRFQAGENPIRIIIDGQLRTPQTAQIFKEPGENIIATTISPPSSWGKIANTTLLQCKKTSENHVELKDLLKKLFEMGIRSLMVEGGEKINTSFLQKKLIDRITLIICPKISQKSSLPSLFKVSKIKPLKLKKRTIKLYNGDIWLEGTL